MDKLSTTLFGKLKQELALLGQLEAVLAQEFTALEQKNTDEVTKNSNKKQELVAQLEQQGQERLGILQQAGVASGKEGLDEILRSESSGELKSLWGELETTLLRCQKQNQVNGILLEKGRQQTQQMLNILLNEGEAGQDDGIYDASGNSTSSSFPNGRSVKV